MNVKMWLWWIGRGSWTVRKGKESGEPLRSVLKKAEKCKQCMLICCIFASIFSNIQLKA